VVNVMSVARSRAVAVVGVGVKTPAGLTLDALWRALCAGRSSAQPVVDERLRADTRVLASRVEGFDPSAYLSPMDQRRFDRAHQLAIGAAQDAMDALGSNRPPAERCGVVCGVGLGAPAFQESQYARLHATGPASLSPLTIPMMMPSALASLLSLRFDFKGPCFTVSTACASGATAIAEGVELIRRGAADLVLAGGADSMLTYSALAGFLRLDVMSRKTDQPALASRPFDAERDGFVIGEGAGFVVLQLADDARAGNRLVHGFIAGHASTSDAHNLVAPSPSGEGALACMRAALLDAGVTAADLSHVNAHGTSTVQGDLSEALALTALFHGDTPPVTAVKGTTGHLIAGSGAVEVIVTLRSLQAGVVPPIAGLHHVDSKIDINLVQHVPREIHRGPALSNSFGFGGINTALVIAAA
jgi:3-oxoacyl-[acyl-carrier-protein] synthase II